jgi:hypothetical protein
MSGIPPSTVRADLHRKLFVASTTWLEEVGEGLVTIERRQGAYFLDLSNVTGVRFSRDMRVPHLRRVKGVTGGCCCQVDC